MVGNNIKAVEKTHNDRTVKTVMENLIYKWKAFKASDFDSLVAMLVERLPRLKVNKINPHCAVTKI